MSAPKTRARATSPGETGQAAGEPKQLSSYRLGERMAQDELATIYRALHQTLDRPVDIHILRRTDWVSVSRFQLAGRLGARLHHANILPVIDAGHDEHYGDYIVTPRLDGRLLKDVLASGPLDPMVALRVFAQLCAALDYLHQQKIMHRDIRPANIVLTPQGVAYLTNFSLAAAPDTPDLSSVDDTDYLTPYSAPEQTVSGGTPTAAQDLYSLGAVLYHMLSGELPPAPGQPTRLLGERDQSLTGADRVVRRLLAVDPNQRFANAEQAHAALRQVLRKQIDDATPDMEESRWEPVAEWLENPLESVLGGLLDQEFIGKTRARADTLHRSGAIRRLLDRWSRQGLMRRPALGQLVVAEQIVSYNIYLYELRAYYETRTPPQIREQIHMSGVINPFAREPELWDVPVPELDAFVTAPPEPIVIPGSQQVLPCTTCNGATQVVCKTCAGKGNLERTQRVKNADGKVQDEKIQQQCPTCRGYGRQPCQKCEGGGQILQEKVFTWSRSAKVHTNEDDISGLHKLTIETQAQPVFSGRIDPYEARWYQVAPLQELLDVAIKDGGPDTRLLTAELTIRGTPVTEVDYRHKNKAHSLALIGFKDELRGDALLYDTERLILYTAIGLLAVALVVVLLFLRG